MEKIKILLLTLMISVVTAQELDEEFLSSLPDDVRKDLVQKNSNQELNTKETYRPYLYSSKLRQAEELLILKERLEQDLLELERRLSTEDSLDIKKDLELFGDDFFNTFQTTYMPINEPNLDGSYTLDFGDVLNIQLVGQNNFIEKMPINSDGSINLPNVGKIIISGLSLDDASKLIKSTINSSFIGTEAYISLAEIRDINILIAGNAMNPGIYTLTGNSNILHAISAAGGINDYGSYREMKLIRNNKVIETLDLYNLLIKGEYNLSKRLRSGDTVFVESRKNVVAIDGAVYRPAYYEVLENENLDDVITFANGIKSTADMENIYLERILDGSLKTIPIVNEIQFKSIKASDGDMIYFREHPYRKAKISGAVVKPGSYTMAAGETIDDLIKKAGGFTENAYVFGAIYQNENAKLVNLRARDILYEEFLDNILAISQQSIQQNIDLTPMISLTKEIKDVDPNGRVVIDLMNEISSNIYTIKEGDELYIPEQNNVVYVYGETSAEGAVIYEENQGVEYFVAKSGGFKKFADTESIYVLHPNGESQLFKTKRNIFESSPQSKIEIYPGSIIFVPRELDESTPKRLAAQAYVSILGNLGIALASLSSINNN